MGDEGNGGKFDLEDRLMEFASMVIDVVDALPNLRAANHIAGQLIRSGTSPAPNYSESQSAESKKDFIHKLKVAFKELRETRLWLRLIARKDYLQGKDADLLRCTLQECEELVRIFGKSVATAEANR